MRKHTFVDRMAQGKVTRRERFLAEMDAVANRVRRVATGWETQLTIAAPTTPRPPRCCFPCAP